MFGKNRAKRQKKQHWRNRRRSKTNTPDRPNAPPPALQGKTWRQRLWERRRSGKFNGCVSGTKVCIDNLGWNFNVAGLEIALKKNLSGVKGDIRFGYYEADGLKYYTGWGCIEFETVEAAVQGMLKLDTLYIQCPGCPIARPIVAHFPVWDGYPWGPSQDVPGYRITEDTVAPHFAQLNNMDRLGIFWKHLDEVGQGQKEEMCKEIVSEICEAIGPFKSQLGVQELAGGLKAGQGNGQCRKYDSSRTFWLKCIPVSITDQMLGDAFKQFDDHVEVQRLLNPVTQQPFGHVLLTIGRREQANLVCADMNEYMYLMGGTRPISVALTSRGAPLGFEAVFDCAVEQCLGVNMDRLDNGVRKLMHISEGKSVAEECAVRVRRILERTAEKRAAYSLLYKEKRQSLHEKQKGHLDVEMKKLEVLSKLIESDTARKGMGKK